MNDAEVRLQVKIDSSSAEKEVSNLSKKTQELSNNISKKTQELSSKLSKKTQELSSKFTQVGKKMTFGVTAPLTALTTAGIKYNSEIETYSANLTTLLSGNKKQADDLLKSLKQMASTTPFETKDLINSTQTMLGFGIEVNKSQKYLKQLGDISMGDSQKLESLTLAFSQVSSAGKLSGQDLLQMINAGFNPLNIISQKTGESMASLKKRMGEGSLSADEVAQSLQWATEEGGLFYKSMDKASQTTAGKISTLKDNFNSALGSMTESLLPFVTSAVEKFSQLAQWFSKLDDNGKKIVLTLAGITAAIGPLSLAIGTLIKVGMGIKTVVGVIKSWHLVTKMMTIAQGALNAVLAINPITWIIIGIVALIAILVLLWNKCEGFRNFVIGLFNGVISIFNAVIEFFKNNWQSILLFVMNPFAGIFKFLYDNFEGFRNFINGIIEAIKSRFITIGNSIKSVFEGIKNAITFIFNGIINIIKTPINALIGLVNGVIKGFNKIKLPSWVPGIGGKGINIPLIPKLATGTNYIAREGLAYLHEGEAVVPKKYNPALGGNTGATYVTVVADMDVNKFGKAFVNNVKTFSGGAKNSYNYGGAR